MNIPKDGTGPCDVLMQVAVHEAAHAVIGKIAGLEIDVIKVGEEGGSVRFCKPVDWANKRQLVKLAAVVMAGVIAVEEFCACPQPELGDDEADVKFLMRHLVGSSEETIREIANQMVRDQREWIRDVAEMLIQEHGKVAKG